MHLAKIGYKSYLEEGVGKLPSLQVPLQHQEDRFSPKEGWALRVVSREMRRARGTDGAPLFQSSEFLTTSQVASFFSRQSATVRQRDVDELDIQAAQEESNFNQGMEAVAAIKLDHPLIYDQYNFCAMAVDGTLKLLKLPMLQHMCEDLGLDISPKPMRKMAL
ncbi:uncharacterized protein [Montipora foliosa]|uniref:uncharacterized protein n=1 Tax=Montipora foliosa TaxID=591990 RepID=UPI0035F1112E